MENRVKGFVWEGTLTWTMTTAAYKYYTLNLLTWLKKAGVPWRLCIICCDTESFTFFQREGVACVKWEMAKARGQQRIASFGTEEFKIWNRAKLDILRFIAEKAAEIGVKESLYLDGDMVVCSDPWGWLMHMEREEKIIWFQCDCANAVEHNTPDECRAPCSGVIYTRHLPESSANLQQLYRFVKEEWLAASEQDQPYITARLLSLQIPFGILPRAEFGNGYWQKSLKWMGADAAAEPAWILLHYNYRVGDTKKAAMKTYGHWLIPY